jgi:H+/Cl- antiporter ClcA
VSGDPTAAADPAASPDPAAILRSRNFAAVLVFAAVIGLVVSVLSWAFLELVHRTQVAVFTDLPEALGHDAAPWWFYVVVLGLAGLPVAFAVVRLPGHGGHVPVYGLQPGGSSPADVPGVALAGFASLGLGLIVGPEAPLIAIGAGIAMFVVRTVKQDAPDQLVMIMAAAGSFAAIAAIFGSPIIAAVLMMEVIGLGGAAASLVMIPGLIAAGVGSLVFVGMATWTGLSTEAYALPPLVLPSFSGITWEIIGWTILLGLVGALVTQVVRRIGLVGLKVVPRNPFVWTPVVGFLVAALAVLFEATTDFGADQVLFSGQEQLPSLIDDAGAWSIGALVMVLLCKGVAWGLCLSAFRGGPVFPAVFIGAAGGILASHLPGLPVSSAIGVGIGVMVVSFLRLPVSAIVMATMLTASAGASIDPLIIIGVVVAYLASLALEGRLGAKGIGFTPPAES